MKIRGNTVGTPTPRTDYEQTDPKKADYLKGKEVLDQKIADAKKAGTDAQTAADNAQTTADNAQTAADNAQTAADNAQTTADNAQVAANNALEGITKSKAGFIYPLAAAVVPEGFLLCDGAAYARSEYPELFAAIGTIYGSGDGSTTFNVPDLRNRVPAGASENHPAGEMVGEETHQLTVYEMPSHVHGINWPSDSGAAYVQPMAAARDKYSELETEAEGGDQPHNNMQPTTYIHGYIIATGKGTGVSVADIILGAQAIPLSLEYGGVGATDPKTARENLEITPENIGAMSMELLWENASPTSEFATQSINIDLSAFGFLMVKTNASKDVGYATMTIVKRTDGIYVLEGNVADGRTVFRLMNCSGTGVWFDQGVLVTAGSDAYNNGCCIPVRIYGIKGVS